MISVFGLGFVGLTTALGFAHHGYKVFGLDTNEDRKSLLRKGRLPFLEPGLDNALTENIGKNFFVSDDPAQAVMQSEFIFYCVGTPYGENGRADLTYLFAAISETLKYLDKSKIPILIIKSTVPPSTTSGQVSAFLTENNITIGQDLLLANNPEFLREGHCWEDFIHADRIVIGTDFREAADRITKLYTVFGVPVYTVSANTGEFIKYLSNTLLATLISYANEMADIADHIGDIETAKAFRILHMDGRWNNCSMTSYVYPGCGYGGYCLPKDTSALYAAACQHGIIPGILGEVINRNNEMAESIAVRITDRVGPEKKIGILGLSFKPDSDDVRDCASAKVIKHLMAKGYANFLAYDPCATDEFRAAYNINAEYCHSLSDIMEKADVLVILTAWKEFEKISARPVKPVLDFRYMGDT
ncbi:MAG: UDP-glucose/GDP-mannose dehydrogenase family protein [Spirochaetales bacterium]|nr:UDP-glucose/GDP-mannose dehydrogenase family protein [Spirochaetales bacterium]